MSMKATGNLGVMKISLCQLGVGSDKFANIENAAEAIEKSRLDDIIVLPECWNSPYSTASFPQYAEVVPPILGEPTSVDSPSSHMLCTKAKNLGVWIVGGSVPEREGDNLYNTCIIVNNQGKIVGKHRKLHLFDIDVPGKIKFKESDSLTAGQTPTIVDTPWGNIGIGICYDIRFPEYATLMRKMGARILIYPGAFNMVTGPAHWELLQRARAVDNQVFVVACSPARDTSGGGYIAWGHSSIISPWGDIVATTGSEEGIVKAELQLDQIDNMRDSIPCWKQKREDLYELKSKL
eukprot:gene11933-15974_t